MPFDYDTSGLPDNPRWRVATSICEEWLKQNMLDKYGDHGIVNFMHNQPVGAAKRIMEHCPDATEETVTLLLLGIPARALAVSNPETEAVTKNLFGEAAIHLIHVLNDRSVAQGDAALLRAADRIELAEAVSALNDQMIRRHEYKTEEQRLRHHDVRMMMMENFETLYKRVKGQDPGLDLIFEESFAKAKVAMDAINLEIATKKPDAAQKPPAP